MTVKDLLDFVQNGLARNELDLSSLVVYHKENERQLIELQKNESRELLLVVRDKNVNTGG